MTKKEKLEKLVRRWNTYPPACVDEGDRRFITGHITNLIRDMDPDGYLYADTMERCNKIWEYLK